jgi:hypothetical protein
MTTLWVAKMEFKKQRCTAHSPLVCLLIALTGCLAKKPISPSVPAFRIEAFKYHSVLLPPSISEIKKSDDPVKLSFQRNSSSLAPAFDCLAERGPFRLEQNTREPDTIQLTLPSIEEWVKGVDQLIGSGSSETVIALHELLNDVDKLKQKGCFDSTVSEFILQSLPTKAYESPYSLYGDPYLRNGVDLGAGMRLKVERAYFQPTVPGGKEPEPKDFLGVSATYFGVESAANNEIRLRQIGDVQYSPPAIAGEHDSLQNFGQELGLGELPPAVHYRLMFYALSVPKEHRTSAAIVGAASIEQLDDADEKLRTNHDEVCKNVTEMGGMSCIEIDGQATITCQVRVQFNQRLEWINWGTRLKDVLAKRPFKSLRVQRVFMHSYYDIKFDPEDSSFSSLALMDEDRLSWSERGRPGPNLRAH